jgi:hypothetical protein
MQFDAKKVESIPMGMGFGSNTIEAIGGTAILFDVFQASICKDLGS